MIDLELPWTFQNTPQGTHQNWNAASSEHLLSGKPSVCQSSNAISVVSGDSIPGGTPLREHWRHFHKWLKSQPVPLEGNAERTSLSSGRNRQCALFHCSANCPSPNTGVQPPVYTTTFSCRSNLRSINSVNVILFSVSLSLQISPYKSFSAWICCLWNMNIWLILRY